MGPYIYKELIFNGNMHVKENVNQFLGPPTKCHCIAPS